MKQSKINELLATSFIFEALRMCEKEGLLTKKGEFILDKVEHKIIRERKKFSKQNDRGVK